MKKPLLLMAIVSLFAVSSFAATTTTTTTATVTPEAKVAMVRTFPITFETSCGTWTGTADCGSLSMSECGSFLNDVGDFLESLCAE